MRIAPFDLSLDFKNLSAASTCAKAGVNCPPNQHQWENLICYPSSAKQQPVCNTTTCCSATCNVCSLDDDSNQHSIGMGHSSSLQPSNVGHSNRFSIGWDVPTPFLTAQSLLFIAIRFLLLHHISRGVFISKPSRVCFSALAELYMREWRINCCTKRLPCRRELQPRGYLLPLEPNHNY